MLGVARLVRPSRGASLPSVRLPPSLSFADAKAMLEAFSTWGLSSTYWIWRSMQKGGRDVRAPVWGFELAHNDGPHEALDEAMLAALQHGFERTARAFPGTAFPCGLEAALSLDDAHAYNVTAGAQTPLAKELTLAEGVRFASAALPVSGVECDAAALEARIDWSLLGPPHVRLVAWPYPPGAMRASPPPPSPPPLPLPSAPRPPPSSSAAPAPSPLLSSDTLQRKQPSTAAATPPLALPRAPAPAPLSLPLSSSQSVQTPGASPIPPPYRLTAVAAAVPAAHLDAPSRAHLDGISTSSAAVGLGPWSLFALSAGVALTCSGAVAAACARGRRRPNALAKSMPLPTPDSPRVRDLSAATEPMAGRPLPAAQQTLDEVECAPPTAQQTGGGAREPRLTAAAAVRAAAVAAAAAPGRPLRSGYTRTATGTDCDLD